MKLFGLEPALIIGTVMSLIAAGVAFGLDVTSTQTEAIEKALTSLLPLIGAILTRPQVVPVAKVEAALGSEAVRQAGAVTKQDLKVADDAKKD